ncbi:retrovirus-related pol polyprotein from transposon TNT 1-94, partial [Tanacetum coccineum]
VESCTTSDSNTPVLSPTGLKCSTSNCGSKPTSNKKNDRISRTSSRNIKNKVEAQPRKVNKKNSVVESIRDVDVKHSLLNTNSEPICATCKKSMFDGVHDMCLLDFVENVNRHIPSSSSLVMTGCPDCSLVSGLRMFKTYDREPLSAHKLSGKCDYLKSILRSQDTNLYTISLDDMLKTSPSCLLSKASNTKSWLWHRLLSHLNFSTLNKLAKDGLARGNPRLKFQKDYLFLRTKDEAPEAIIKCIKNIKVRLNATVRNVRTDNGTKFVNQTLREFYESVGISHQTSVARTPQQNGVVERRNRTLVEAARTISGPGLHSITPATSSSGLVPNTVSQQPCIPPNKDDWDHLF